MSKKIRVLRVLEYVYDDVEVMEKDMARWAVPHVQHTNKLTIRSTTLPFEVVSDD